MYGKQLKEIREEKNYSQTELSKKTGISQQNISFWENNKRTPNIEFCVQLAQFYGITLDELIGLSDSTPPTKAYNLPTQPQSKAIAFATEYADIINDNNFISISKLYKAITPELRGAIFGYIVGLLQSNGVNIKSILGY